MTFLELFIYIGLAVGAFFALAVIAVIVGNLNDGEE